MASKKYSTAEFYAATNYNEKRIEITAYNHEVARLIRAHLRSDALATLSSGDAELAEELIHLYNTLTDAMDKMEGKKDE